MKQTNGVLWVVEMRGSDDVYIPLSGKVTHSRLEAKRLKERTQDGYPRGEKFRVAKYVREGEGQ